jgi:AmmeMemoRadiSam system protein B
MKRLFILSLGCLLILAACNTDKGKTVTDRKVRQQVDTVGFAQYSWQIDSVMERIDRVGWKRIQGDPWKLAICPHDDYTYVGKLYPEVLQNVKADNVFLIGVAHKAAQLKLENYLIFDTYSSWYGPYGNVPVSPVRNEIFQSLKEKYAIISDTMHAVEHSLESMIPFMQYFNRDISIIPVLVPAMSPERMDECGRALAKAIRDVADSRQWTWGKDYAIVVTTDADHYGNEDWGGKDYAMYGCDEEGNAMARAHEREIIENCLKGKIDPENFRLFSYYTLDSADYHNYKWYWCGRYCIPVALYTAYYLNDAAAINGEFIGYSTSITSEHIPVEDLGMGTTAIATDCHWVGYAALGYR